MCTTLEWRQVDPVRNACGVQIHRIAARLVWEETCGPRTCAVSHVLAWLARNGLVLSVEGTMTDVGLPLEPNLIYTMLLSRFTLSTPLALVYTLYENVYRFMV